MLTVFNYKNRQSDKTDVVFYINKKRVRIKHDIKLSREY